MLIFIGARLRALICPQFSLFAPVPDHPSAGTISTQNLPPTWDSSLANSLTLFPYRPLHLQRPTSQGCALDLQCRASDWKPYLEPCSSCTAGLGSRCAAIVLLDLISASQESCLRLLIAAPRYQCRALGVLRPSRLRHPVLVRLSVHLSSAATPGVLDENFP